MFVILHIEDIVDSTVAGSTRPLSRQELLAGGWHAAEPISQVM